MAEQYHKAWKNFTEVRNKDYKMRSASSNKMEEQYTSKFQLGPIRSSSDISTKESLENAHRSFKGTLNIIERLNEIVPGLIQKYVDGQKDEINQEIANLNEIGKKELKKYNDYIENIKKFDEGTIKIDEIGTLEILHDGLSNTLAKRFSTSLYDSRFNMFLKEMSLGYIVSGFEGFIADCLETLFVISPNTLKSGKMFTYEEILGYKDMEELKQAMIAEEVNFALRKGIDGIADYFKNKLGLDLNQHDDWNDFCELFYRRNMVIHNNCYPDRTYRIKTGFNDKSVRLTIDKAYLSRCISMFGKYYDRIYEFFVTKFANSNA